MKKKMNKATIKTAEEHYTALIESYEKAAKEHCIETSKYCVQAEDHATNAENQAIVTKDYADKAEAAFRGAADNVKYASEQANVAKNAANSSYRYYLDTKAIAEDSVGHRKRAEKSALDARHEARSAMVCVVWCFCAAVLSLLFLIAHFIL